MKKRFKQTLCMLLSVLMITAIFTALPFTVSAAATEYTTSTGGTYSFDPDTGELHLISGVFTGTAWQNGSNWTAEDFSGEDVLHVTADEGVKFTGNCSSMFSGRNGAFANCVSYDLSKVDTSNVTNMMAMFYRNYAMTSLDISGFDTRNVTNISSMFVDCTSLNSLDLSGFDTRNVRNNNNGYVFANCSKLCSLTISPSFKGGVVSGMYLNNGKPTDKGWITSDSTDGAIVSGGVTSQFAVIAQPAQKTTYIWYAHAGVYEFIPETGTLHLISGFFKGHAWHNGSNWTAEDFNGEDVLHVTADEGVKFTGDCSAMFDGSNGAFANCVSYDLSKVDTSNVTSMSAMFCANYALTSLDLSSFNTSNVIDISHMFTNCTSLTTLDLSNFDTSKLTDSLSSVGMFENCPKLRSLTISESFKGGVVSGMYLNTGKPTDKGWITSDSTDGTIVSGTDTFAVIEQPAQKTTYIWYGGVYEFIEETGTLHLISGFFRGTTWQLRSGTMVWTAEDFNGEDVLHVTADEGVKFTGDCGCMFYGQNGAFTKCETYDLSKVDTSTVTNMYAMFCANYALTTLDLSSFDTSNVTNISVMFANCTSLNSLDLSGFDTSSVTETSNMFANCSNLRSLTISEKFNGGVTGAYMSLNNGEDRNGWRVKGESTAEKVSGDGTYAVISAPASETTYKWIGYFDVDWNNWDGTKLVKTEEYKAETDIHPTYKGAAPTKPESGGKAYELYGWTDDENTYRLNDALPVVTKDTTYTAVFREANQKYFVAENLSLKGDIGVNFLIDMHDAVPENSTVTLHWYKYTEPHTVSNLKTITSNGKKYYIATARVAAKEMADTITATLTEDDTILEEITYSVKTYADKIIKTEDLNDLGSQFASMSAEKQAQLKDLCKAMLKYGAACEAQFDDAWNHSDAHPVSATYGINYNGYTELDIPSYTTPDYSGVFSKYGMEYYASTIGTKTTTNYRVAFKAVEGKSTPPTIIYNGAEIAPDTTSGTNAAIYDFNNIYAKDITNDIEVTVEGVDVSFNMLAYIAKAAADGDPVLQNSVKALYNYGEKAKAFFAEP